jgi:TetR/AcrR family transcriptional regulator
VPRLPAADRRRQLIEAAMDLFSRKGFAGTTTKEIALAAGVSEAIIFRHFATKRDLYTAILEHNLHSAGTKEVLAGLEACMKRRDDEGLFRLIASKIVEGHRRDARFEKLILHASLEGHELATIYRSEFGLPIFDSFRAYLDRRQRSGALRHIDSGAVIVAIVGMAHYYALNAQQGLLTDEQMVEAFVRILMNGIRGPRQEKKSK